ncbi:MAG: OmpA family protein [Myxococcales bacterium]|nr:OmpA family protein [Myxococcales bacterium]
MHAYRAASLASLAILVGCGSADIEVGADVRNIPTVQAVVAGPASAPPAASSSPPLVMAEATLENDRITIAKNIHYDVDKDEIRADSFPTLDAVVQILGSHPEITQITVEGHTDSQGSFEHNRKLSERRANAVVRYLVGKGVKQQVLAAGYGATAPVCRTDDEVCKAQNRRVEFKVKKQ